MINIRPMPDTYGVGFTSMEKLPSEFFQGYREEQAGRYWNYHVTTDNWLWPIPIGKPKRVTIDGFSPNLNKALHVGHLRNLALAVSIKRIFAARAVAILGCTLGIKEESKQKLLDWFNFVDYHPEIDYDIHLDDLIDDGEIKYRIDANEASEYKGAGIWDGPKGPVVIIRSDGRKTYSYYDLAFAKLVKPDYYITGAEQKEHFEALGLGDKHLPMGLVLGKYERPCSCNECIGGTPGKCVRSSITTGWEKLKSRTGDAMSAEEAMQQVVDFLKKGNIEKTKEALEELDYRRLAWNVVAWNLLHVSRNKDVKFEPERWTSPEEPGLYITYTCARVKAALDGCELPVEAVEYTQADVNLIGFSEYFHYYFAKAVESFDPSPIANFAHDLARKLGSAYESERMIGGRKEFCKAMSLSLSRLTLCMNFLGMFNLQRV